MESCNPKLVVWDLDGTLLDSFVDIHTNVNVAMRRFGLPEHDYATVKSFVGDGVESLIRRALGPAHADLFDTVMPWYDEYYRRHPGDRGRVYPGVMDALAAARMAGARQAILTNKPHAVTEQVCARHGLDTAVDAVWGQLEGRPRKPDAAALGMAMTHFGVAPGETAMIGDGLPDMQVARNAGVRSICVGWGQLDREQARLAGADDFVERPEALMAALGIDG